MGEAQTVNDRANGPAGFPLRGGVGTNEGRGTQACVIVHVCILVRQMLASVGEHWLWSNVTAQINIVQPSAC